MKNTMMRLTLTVAGLVLLSSLSFGANRRFEKSFSVTPGGKLTVTTDVGSIRVTGGSGNQVTILAELEGSKRDVEDFDITATEVGGGVEVRGKNSHGWSFFRWNSLDVRYTITVPHEYNLMIKTSGGDIVVGSIHGIVEGKTSGGEFDVSDVDGNITLTTSGGGITVTKVSGTVKTKTSGGSIAVSDLKGDLDAGTSGGGIRVSEVEGAVRARTSGGSIKIGIVGANKGISAQTSGGSIEIEVPRDIAADIDASTSGGDVTSDLPVTVLGKMRESSMRGTVNGGGNPIKVSTSGGSIRIRARH